MDRSELVGSAAGGQILGHEIFGRLGVRRRNETAQQYRPQGRNGSPTQ
jgi:hypothetical protein